MTSEQKCPYCEKPITVWAVMMAPLPWLIRCQHCRQKIRVRNVLLYFNGYILAAALIAAFVMFARGRQMISGGALIGIALVSVLILEFMASLVILRKGAFGKRDDVKRGET